MKTTQTALFLAELELEAQMAEVRDENAYALLLSLIVAEDE